ncbi:hypothetical protein [Halobacteriovorax marinus]|uniref:hypothetical protein n=1 Tax=Halobacteriovorax marinus TaxID=97084 RepID=UPI003A900C98
MFNQTSDEIYLLNTIDRWRNLRDTQEDFEDIHTLNAFDYISSLNSLFLTAFKNLESLNNFSFIQSRDGAMDLLHFFNLYRSPKNLITKLLLHKKFSHIVPNAWLSNIIFYEDCINSEISQDTDTLVYVSSYRNESINEEQLLSIKEKYKIKKLFICGDVLPKKTDLFHSEVSTCERVLNLKSQYLTNKRVLSFSENNSIVYEDTNSSILFHKSFISRSLINNGIKPVNFSLTKESLIFDTPYSGIKTLNLESRDIDPLNIYLWLDKNNKAFKLTDYYEQLDNSNNTRKFYFDSSYDFSKSIFENKNIFYN